MTVGRRVRKTIEDARRIVDGAVSLSRRAEALGRDAAASLAPSPARLRELAADHALRHRPSGFAFAFAEAIDHLRPEHWDELTDQASVCLGRRYLRRLESARPEGLKQHYAIAYRDGEPVVALAAQSLAVSAASIPRGERGRAVLSSLRQRVLVCGNLFGWGPQGVATAHGAGPEAWHAVAEALYRIRRQDVLFGQTGLVMIKDLPGGDTEAAAALRRYGYTAMRTEPDMVLPLQPEWRAFEDYLGALRSDYRKKIRKQAAEIEAAGLSVESWPAETVARRAAELHGLYMQVHAPQKLRLVTVSPEWMPALAAEYGEGFETVAIRRPADDHVAGFVTVLREGDGAIGYYIGFDKALAAAGVPLYLRLLHAVVECGIRWGARRISMGRTALEPKANLGAQGVPLTCYVRHRVPAMNAVVQALLRVAPAADLPPERTPFKAR